MAGVSNVLLETWSSIFDMHVEKIFAPMAPAGFELQVKFNLSLCQIHEYTRLCAARGPGCHLPEINP